MNRFCSMFSQILQLFSRSEFELLVKETKAERHARGFSCWNQFVSMMFCQLGVPTRCVRFAMGFRVAKGNSRIWGLIKRPTVLL